MGAHRRAFRPRCALAAAAVHFLLHVRIHLRKIDVADALFAHGGLSSIVTSCFNPNFSRFGTEAQHSKRARTTHANALHLKHEPMRAFLPARESSTFVLRQRRSGKFESGTVEATAASNGAKKHGIEIARMHRD